MEAMQCSEQIKEGIRSIGICVIPHLNKLLPNEHLAGQKGEREYAS